MFYICGIYIIIYRKSFMKSISTMTKNYHCPRCKSEEVIDLGDSIGCTVCKDKDGLPLEFDKILLGTVPDDEVLARQETSGFLSSIEELKDKREKLLDSIIEDLTDDN
jgi:hypothetical protein